MNTESAERQSNTSLTLSDLSHEDLVEQYQDMVCWWHYNPHCVERPSTFDLIDLREELMRRLAVSSAVSQSPEF